MIGTSAKKKKNRNYKKPAGQDERSRKLYTPGKPVPVSQRNYAHAMSHLQFSRHQMERVMNIIETHPGMTLDDLSCIMSKVVDDYHAALAARGISMTPEVLRSKNIIDLSELSDDELDEYVNKQFLVDGREAFYYMIPCFSEGLVTHKLSRMIYYKILELDPERQYMKLFMQDYLLFDKKMGKEIQFEKYQPGVYGTCELLIDCDDPELCSVEAAETHDLPELYRMLTPKQIGWCELEAQVWKRVILQHSDNIAKRQAEAGASVIVSLFQILVSHVAASNGAMASHRMKRQEAAQAETEKQAPEQASAGTQATTTKKHAAGTGQEKPVPERVVHHVGKIRIISESKPRRVTKSSIRRYRLDSWERRGHVRHMKSGKTVYIKAQTMHRKKSRQDGPSAGKPASTIIVHRPEANTKESKEA